MSAARTLVTAGAALFFLLHSADVAEAAQLGWGNGRGPVSGFAGTDEIDRAIVSAVEGTAASVGGAPAGSSSAPADCHWVTSYQAVEETRRLRPESITLVGVERVEGDGTRSRLYARVCAGQIAQWRWVHVSDHGAAAAELAQEVRRRLPAPWGRFSPDLITTSAVVHVPLWFAVPGGQWSPVDASARTPEVTLTVTATPVALRFEPGDGARSVTCPGPGEVYAPGAPEPEHPPACSYTYTDASSIAPGGVWSARLLIDWEVTWAASDGQTGTLPPMATVAAVPVVVREIQAIERAR
ncbi:hypothetical protein [Parafrankia sp. EUN1f]|uniref:hypothetical protein n=1 Tax=Parafrankia sp. EUN1f TaxID=102897 RepID=UPI0001C45207|nr:hypothetical protein [Parafrankia sp. EUN1f]EFC82850.1 hypothetical protein FrEUN1fDRAFT_4047 [Parafrankia sp. EUN1f]